MITVLFMYLPLNAWYLVEVYSHQTVPMCNWAAGFEYFVFFSAVLIMWVGFTLLTDKDSPYPFTPEEMDRGTDNVIGLDWALQRRGQKLNAPPRRKTPNGKWPPFVILYLLYLLPYRDKWQDHCLFINLLRRTQPPHRKAMKGWQ